MREVQIRMWYTLLTGEIGDEEKNHQSVNGDHDFLVLVEICCLAECS